MDKIFVAMIACLPSAITGFCFWLIQHKIQKDANQRDREKAEAAAKEKRREELREQQELYLVQGVNAAITLAEATARAVQRIPDAHCNGDMHAALDCAKKVREQHKEFLEKQGIIQLYED